MLTGKCEIGSAVKEVIDNLNLLVDDEYLTNHIHEYFFDYTTDSFLGQIKSPVVVTDLPLCALDRITASFGQNEGETPERQRQIKQYSNWKLEDNYQFVSSPKPDVTVLFNVFNVETNVHVKTPFVETTVPLSQLEQYPEIYKYVLMNMKQVVHGRGITRQTIENTYSRFREMLRKLTDLKNQYTFEQFKMVHGYHGCYEHDYNLWETHDESSMFAPATNEWILTDDIAVRPIKFNIYFNKERARIVFADNRKAQICYIAEKDQLLFFQSLNPYTDISTVEPNTDFYICSTPIGDTSNSTFIDLEIVMIHRVAAFEEKVNNYIQKLTSIINSQTSGTESK